MEPTSAATPWSAHRQLATLLTHGSSLSYIDEQMKDEIIVVRVSPDLRDAIEKARKKMSERARAEVTTSAAIRSLIEQSLHGVDR